MAKGCKTKLLWENPEYKLHMKQVHMGQKISNLEQLRSLNRGNKYCLGRKPWNKGIKTAVISVKSEDDYKMRRLFRARIQKLVFERDNYTCQLCGAKNTDLQVDHVQSWAEYVELRFNINNCRTLCAKCHYYITFHKPMPKETRAWGHNLLDRRIIT